MTELYVYYKVERSKALQVRATLERFPDVRLLLREDEDGALQTWMEIHAGPLAQASEQAVAQAIAPLLSGARHVERFQPIADAA
jgi:hypothetical protein